MQPVSGVHWQTLCQLWGGLSSLPIPLLQHQGWWHRASRTVQQWQHCFLTLGFIIEALFSLMSLSVQAHSGGIKQHVWWWSLPSNYLSVAALTTFYLAGWLQQSLLCKPAAPSSSEQFPWMLCWLSPLTACAQEGAGQSLPVIPQGESRGEGGACQFISKEPFTAAPCLPAMAPFPKTTCHQNPTLPVWAESLHLVLHVPSALTGLKPAWQEPWRPPSFLEALHPAGSPHEGKNMGGSPSPCSRFLVGNCGAAALASKAFKFSQLSLPSLRSFFFFSK